jgi:hypothetical protein
MEEIYPRWLNKKFIKKTLTSAGDSSLEVVSYNVTNATAAGDNYLSDMYRVTASLTRGYLPEVTSFIVKCSRESEDNDEVRDRDNEQIYEQQQIALMRYNFQLIYSLTFEVTNVANPSLLIWYALSIVQWLQTPKT